MSSEKFCLRWNDFEKNISSAFRDIRDDKEFFDITIACEDEQLQAHKVILSACSPFFKSVLRRNQHQHPLLYLKGVSFKDMESVLNFMYHGEVNVAQDDLNSFLQVAEDLRVKGLTQNNSANAVNETKKPMDISKSEPRSELIRPRPTEYEQNPTLKRLRPNPPAAPRILPQSRAQQDDIEEILPVVKSEPREPTPTVMATPIQPMVQEQTMAMYDDGSQQMEGNMMTENDTEQYDDNYGGEYEGQYGDQSYDSGGQMAGDRMEAAGTAGADSGGRLCEILDSGGKTQCGFCFKFIHPSSFKRHVKNQHGDNDSSQVLCDVCNKFYKNEATMKEHKRIAHNIYQRLNFD